jgi:ABC-type multidrug transport system ATPase subunit/ABC-type multidrug transport system permease subunit
VPGGPENPACKEYTGQYVMESLGFPSNWIVRPILILLAFVFAFYLGAALILQLWKVEMSVSKAQKIDTDASAGKEKMTAVRSLDEVRTVHVSLHDYGLDVERRKSVMEKSQIPILKHVTATFEPRVLNVIMGPSGSGKSSLLNGMGCRLHNSMTTKYQTHGEILFNGAVPWEGVIRSICGFVSQDDDSLLPYLTVRENLHFAAGLRLPTHLSKEEKVQRAEAVLLKMGLRDCADTLVGNALVKGISGGEKRRVTISIQILTEPRVLLLDEPTSGLDAFTASSIIDVLRGLANEGRTLILTIHQSRSDLFNHFGNILLLTRGGSSVFAGKGSRMVPHFAALGYECPVATNPADFALDLITVNLQQSVQEARSRETVQSLISSWDNARPPIRRVSSHIATPAELGSLARAVTPFRIAFPLLLRRSFINFRRNPPSVIARTTQVLGFAILLTLFFAPLQHNYYSVQTRVGFIQEFAALYFVGMLQNVAVYPDEKQVFYSEHDDHAYSVEAFFFQYTIAEIPFEICTAILFAVLTVIAAGLPRSATLFFITAFNAFAIVSCGESVGIIFNTVVAHTGFAVSLTSIVLSVATIMGGVMSLNIPPVLQAFNHLSPIKWSIGNLAPYSLRGVVFTCTEFQRLANGRCPIETGEDVLRLYGLNGNARLNVLALGLCVIAYRALGYLVLKARRTEWRWRSWMGKGG